MSETQDLFSYMFDQPEPEQELMPERSTAPRGGTAKPYTVSELTRRIRMLLEGAFATVWVEGEISNFKAHISGHYYFTLKDENTQIPAVMFRNANAKLKFRPENGMQVSVTGRVQIYEPQGKYQILCDTIEPSGIGSLQIAYEQLKKKLADRVKNPNVPRAALSGAINIYKIKLSQAGYRLVYAVQDKTITVTVIAVGKRNRNEIYEIALSRLEP